MEIVVEIRKVVLRIVAFKYPKNSINIKIGDTTIIELGLYDKQLLQWTLYSCTSIWYS